MRSLGPYPGPYAYPYPGPTRPYPELREPRGRFSAEPGRIPRTALAAGVLGIVGVAPLVPLTVAAVMFGGLWGDADVEWWLYLLPAAPVLELWGAIWLLGRRGWRFPALSFLPGTGIFATMVAGKLTHQDGLGLGWYMLALVFPLIALVLTPLPPVRRWIRTRPRVRKVPAG
jgi:hypothetical protein